MKKISNLSIVWTLIAILLLLILIIQAVYSGINSDFSKILGNGWVYPMLLFVVALSCVVVFDKDGYIFKNQPFRNVIKHINSRKVFVLISVLLGALFVLSSVMVLIKGIVDSNNIESGSGKIEKVYTYSDIDSKEEKVIVLNNDKRLWISTRTESDSLNIGDKINYRYLKHNRSATDGTIIEYLAKRSAK
ncbi:hypothetical protein [Staphylococcus chromogenes]|uniref:hypothetical protein n=1 Tax=Staphylococcus chromogenes TaxID=46126 RepID=UPI0018906357|nr:hypothetical protein [Staphylococcus chromogenes]